MYYIKLRAVSYAKWLSFYAWLLWKVTCALLVVFFVWFSLNTLYQMGHIKEYGAPSYRFKETAYSNSSDAVWKSMPYLMDIVAVPAADAILKHEDVFIR